MILQLCVCVLPEDEENVLHIGGIFPIAGEGGWQGGQACMPAANLALTDVNNRADLLPGFTLRLHSNDSEVPTLPHTLHSSLLPRFSILYTLMHIQMQLQTINK